jgi:hypothetical protein
MLTVTGSILIIAPDVLLSDQDTREESAMAEIAVNASEAISVKDAVMGFKSLGCARLIPVRNTMIVSLRKPLFLPT